jgi:peptide deformylase
MNVTRNANLVDVDIPSLKLIHYPDPRLRQPATPIVEVDDTVRALAARMFEVMFEKQGVGLAATQVGVGVRMFVGSPTYEPSDRRVYINPQIIASQGEQESEEGCLSLPGITIKLKRLAFVTIRALNLAGESFEETGEELTARLFQHETDHLDGRLLVDRMGSVAKLANRRTLRELEDKFSQR